ncbi:MAG: LacI family DNA-binding transcriptional regulator [Rhodobacteraceae bacterium]|nr:LacI family DNA-binding transcriptional regulator [Paracoccaceae bacterium]
MTIGQRTKRSTVRDVAKAAKVSVATVSRVLNSPEVVQPDTRMRVERAIAELRFVRNAAAWSINTGRTNIVGVLLPSLESDLFAMTISAIEGKLEEFGLSLIVATTNEVQETETRKARELLDIGVEGLILTGVLHGDNLYELLDRAQIPVVAISNFDPTYRYPTVGYDNKAAARCGLEFLLGLGHRRIAVVHGPTETNDRMRDRVAGAVASEASVEVAYHCTELSMEGGGAAVREILRSGPFPDGVLCVSDILAIGVLFEFQRHGVRVPNHVSVMGLHDLPISQFISPRLSTVRLPSRRMGKSAAVALARWIEEGTRPSPILLPTELSVRESTRD